MCICVSVGDVVPRVSHSPSPSVIIYEDYLINYCVKLYVMIFPLLFFTLFVVLFNVINFHT